MSDLVLALARKTNGGAIPRIGLAGATLFLNVRGDPSEGDHWPHALIVAEQDVERDVLARVIAPALALTAFARCRPVGTLPGPSTNGTTRGLLVGATDCGDPSGLAEFHDFYDRTHAREVMDSGQYWRGRRFERLPTGDMRDDSLPRFFALYETEQEATAAYRELKKHPMTMEWPKVFLVRAVWSFNAV